MMSSTLRNAAIVVVALSGFLFGCATSQKTQVVQPGDRNLSCNAVNEEWAKLDKAQAEIDSKKGVTGTNVAAAIFWLPGLAYTYYDAGEATRLISDRRVHSPLFITIRIVHSNNGCQPACVFF
jgi:hypothetical protein